MRLGWATIANGCGCGRRPGSPGATTKRPYSLAARSLAMRGERRVEAREAGAFGVARDRPRSAFGQVVAEPGVALRERLRMAQTAAMPSSESTLRSRLWRT
jgi:hypothetical protein